jgi:primosomal protein N' (replication factor Y)
MRILTVIPITTNTKIDELTYFSLTDVPLGSIVQVPIRKKEVPALVIKSDDASHMKAILRRGDFALKRIGATPPQSIIPSTVVRASQHLALYYATHVGSIINTMIPRALLTSAGTKSAHTIQRTDNSLEDTTPEIYALQAPLLDRLAIYKSSVREAFAKKKSLIIIVPTIATAQHISEAVSGGLEERVFTLTSKNTALQQIKTFNTMHASEKPVLLVATARYATLYRQDVETIIVEDESSHAYDTLKRPYITTTEYIKEYARISGLKLILASTVLRVKTHDKLTKGSMLELAPQSTRTRSTVMVDIIDTRKDELRKKNVGEEKPSVPVVEAKTEPFTAISKELHIIIAQALKAKKRIFILAPRRGIAPLTVCNDCKTPVICPSCSSPISLRQKNTTEREFLCYKCGETKDPDTTCSYCNSWRLTTIGIGIELIEAELRKKYPKKNIHRIDKHITKTDKQIQTTIETFNEKGHILIGTSAALPFLSPVPVTAVASLDAMLSVPSFQIDEDVFNLLLKCKDVTSESLFIQTRMPERSVLERAAAGDIATFIREELALRKALKYPPYTVMIKITRTGSKRQIIEDFQNIMPSLEPYGPRVFKQFRTIRKNVFALHALLRIKVTDYPDTTLAELLRSIQPMFEVKIDME